MVYFPKLVFVLHKNNIIFKDEVIPGSLKIQIIPTLSGSEIHEISGTYFSKNNITKYDTFKLESNFFDILKDKLVSDGEDSLQKITNYLLTNNINFKLENDTETDSLQSGINAFLITISLILAITYCLNKQVICNEIYDSFKIKLHDKIIDLNLCNYNYSEKIIIYSNICKKFNPENWLSALEQLLSIYKNIFTPTENLEYVQLLKEIYTNLNIYYEWKDLEINNTINYNRNLLYNNIVNFIKNIDICKDRYNTLINYNNDKINKLKTYYNSQDEKNFIYSDFVNLSNKIDELILYSEKICNYTELKYDFSLDNIIISIYDKIGIYMDSEKANLISDQKKSKDDIYNENKKKIEETDDKINNLLTQKNELINKLSDIKKEKKEADEDENETEKIKIEISKLEQKIKKTNTNIESLKKDLVNYNDILHNISKNIKKQSSEIEINISNKKSEYREILDNVKLLINNSNKIFKKYEYNKNNYIKIFIEKVKKFIDCIKIGLSFINDNFKDESSINIIRKYNNFLDTFTIETNILKTQNIIYNDFETYETQGKNIEIYIDTLFNNIFDIYKKHNETIKSLINNIYIKYTDDSNDIINFEEINHTKLENIFFEKLEFELLINILNTNNSKLIKKKNILDNISIYYEKIKICFDINNNSKTVKLENRLQSQSSKNLEKVENRLQSQSKEKVENKENLEKVEKIEINKNLENNKNNKNLEKIESNKNLEIKQNDNNHTNLNNLQKNEIIKLMDQYISSDSDSRITQIQKFEEIEENLKKITEQMEKMKKEENKKISKLETNYNNLNSKIDTILELLKK